MKRSARTLSTLGATAILALGGAALAPTAYADPASDTGLQTSVCDNGETYVFSLRERARLTTPVHDPASTTVIVPLASSGTVTITEAGASESFPYAYGRVRAERSPHLVTCSSTFDLWDGPVHVHVESTDVVLVSGRR